MFAINCIISCCEKFKGKTLCIRNNWNKIAVNNSSIKKIHENCGGIALLNLGLSSLLKSSAYFT